MPAYSTLYEILLYLLLLGNVCVKKKKKLLITLEIPTITKNHRDVCVLGPP